jgi:hypothetical protein
MELELVKTAGTEGKWKYVSCSVTVGDMDKDRKCQMCGKKNHRFTHTLIYPNELGRIRGTYENYIFVGVDCAAILIDGDPEIPRLAENETQRKERWRIHYGNEGTCRTTLEDLIERGKL